MCFLKTVDFFRFEAKLPCQYISFNQDQDQVNQDHSHSVSLSVILYSWCHLDPLSESRPAFPKNLLLHHLQLFLAAASGDHVNTKGGAQLFYKF